MRILSGIQPSGVLHLGNYFGMMLPSIELQTQGEAYYFIADYHSMTSLFDPVKRREYTMGVALDFLACGLDPEKVVFFRQSDVPEVTELTWLLTTVTPMGLLERCHSYKDKVSRGLQFNHGLFAYPVLMAADILLYDSNIVPVGRDQKQHVEVTRDIAIKFNQLYGETFVLPESKIRGDVEAIPGTDGQKMSKSYGNTIEIFGEEKAVRKKVMGLLMDSRDISEPKPDAQNNLAIQYLRLLLPASEAQEEEERLRLGGYGYGSLKKNLFEKYWEYFRAAREKRHALSKDLGYVHSILADGAEKARFIASGVLSRAKRSCGLSE
ncbi:MAG: tryptophan--tRNA ligase [Verrucomicrobia bacterium]|nr:tryptophan--tRNA ligase [Verrucomicrobiota bacterium]